MSFNTLIRALSPSVQSISDAAADYKKDCNAVAQFIKRVLSLGLKDTWDHYYNVPSKREAVSDLEVKLQALGVDRLENDSEFQFKEIEDSEQESEDLLTGSGQSRSKVEFKFEGEIYRLTDIHYHETKKQDALEGQQLVIEIKKGEGWVFIEVVFGSLKELAKRAAPEPAEPVVTAIPTTPIAKGPKYTGKPVVPTTPTTPPANGPKYAGW